MAERIPQSVSKLVVFRAFLASDGVTSATGKTIAITISKNGGAFGNPNAGATNATEISSGFYKFTLDTTDTGTTGPLAFRGAESSINDVGDVFEVVKATNAGFSALPDAAAEAAGGLYTRGTGAGQINQDANGRIDTNRKASAGRAVTTGAVQTDAGNSATQIKTNLTASGTDHFKDCLVKLTSGTLADEVKKCTGSTGTTNCTLTFTSGFTATPADAVTFELVND